ncbi:MAG TPA: hypothetical protein VEK33_08010 [Terriglobales bacterium]|nr:hypothetical protein [Terriglobales bacterium]
MPESAAFCPGCGRHMMAAPDRGDPPGPFRNNLAAALSYVSFVPAVIFLRLQSYNRNRLVRFHALQSIFLAITAVLAAIVLRILFALLSLIPRLGYLFAWLAVLVAVLAAVTVWLVVMIKALQGERFKLPGIGSLAERV